MLSQLNSLKGLIKTKSYHIDLPFFRIHYQITVSVLLAFCLILTAKVLFGDTIDCVSKIKTHDKYYDNICYSIGTYTRYKIKQEGTSIRIDNVVTNVSFKVDPESRYIYSGIMIGDEPVQVFWHTYYQYIPILLFVQAVLFYFPHYLWKTWENGVISSICKRLHDNRFTPAEYFESNNDLIYYIQNCLKFNKSLVYKYHLCHVLLLFNLIIQIIVLNVIFNNQFISYGYVVINYLLFDSDIYGMRHASGNNDGFQYRNLNNPMDLVFPKMTSCRVELFSQAGKSPDVTQFLCVLPLNILHDKFFLLLWFWFLILGVLTVIQIICDLLYTTLPFFRKQSFTRRHGPFRRSSLTELFILDLIGSNSDKHAFTTLLRILEINRSSP